MNADLRQLSCFRTVARLQHVTRAAEQLHISQPAVSRILARLENELGVPLFEPAGRNVRLTRYGARFLERVESALDLLDDGRRELADMKAGRRGAIALGFLRSLAAAFVPDAVRAFRALHPQVEFTFRQARSASLEAKLRGAELDLCITTAPAAGEGLAWERILDQDVFVVVPPSHRLAAAEDAPLEAFANDRFITFARGHGTRELLERLALATGFSPRIAFEGDDASGIRGFVAAGFGVALQIAPPSQPGLRSVRITSPGATRPIGVAWRAERYLATATRAFRDALLAGTRAMG
ncbi:MAG TPA: LysR family transcriptional regulator [Candidatus Acidoferrum sp.]|nr:LysR family transcriptional regulator [Candidatus Acidoferrum sp.]